MIISPPATAPRPISMAGIAVSASGSAEPVRGSAEGEATGAGAWTGAAGFAAGDGWAAGAVVVTGADGWAAGDGDACATGPYATVPASLPGPSVGCANTVDTPIRRNADTAIPNAALIYTSSSGQQAPYAACKTAPSLDSGRRRVNGPAITFSPQKEQRATRSMAASQWTEKSDLPARRRRILTAQRTRRAVTRRRHPGALVAGTQIAINFNDPAFLADPYPTYAELRRDAPVCPSDYLGWLILRHEDISALLHDQRLASGPLNDSLYDRFSEANLAAVEPFRTAMTHNMLLQDPPEHSRLR